MSERLPSQATLVELLDLRGGRLFWKERPASFFAASDDPAKAHREWNLRNAGNEAFLTVGNHGYRVGIILGVQATAHRIVWKMVHGTEPPEIDHISGVRTDNHPDNLRAATSRENKCNRAIGTRNNSGVMGVSRCSTTGLWRATIKANGKQVSLGRHHSLEAAVEARKSAELEYGYHPNHGRQPTAHAQG